MHFYIYTLPPQIATNLLFGPKYLNLLIVNEKTK